MVFTGRGANKRPRAIASRLRRREVATMAPSSSSSITEGGGWGVAVHDATKIP